MENIKSIIPLLVARCSKPVTLNHDFLEPLDIFSDVILAKDNREFIYTMSITKGVTIDNRELYIAKLIFKTEGHKPIIHMQIAKNTKADLEKLAHFTSVPSKIFVPKDIDVLLFPRATDPSLPIMTAQEVDDILSKWNTPT